MSARDEGVFVVILMKTEATFPRVLLQLRKNTGLHDGKFGFPGGKRIDKEPWPEVAVRELKEETGLDVNKQDLQCLCRYGGRDRDGTEWRGTFYFYVIESCCGKDLVKEPGKHDRVEWHPVNKLPKNVVPTVYKVISDLKDKIAPPNSSKAKSHVRTY